MNVNFGLFPPPPEGTPKQRAQGGAGPARARGAGGLGDKSRRAHIAACHARENC